MPASGTGYIKFFITAQAEGIVNVNKTIVDVTTFTGTLPSN